MSRHVRCFPGDRRLQEWPAVCLRAPSAAETRVAFNIILWSRRERERELRRVGGQYPCRTRVSR